MKCVAIASSASQWWLLDVALRRFASELSQAGVVVRAKADVLVQAIGDPRFRHVTLVRAR